MYLGAPSTLAQLADSTFEYDMAPQPEGDVDYSPFIGQASMVVFADGNDSRVGTAPVRVLHQRGRLGDAAVRPPRASLQTAEFVSALYPQVPAESAEPRRCWTRSSSRKQIDYPVAFPELETATKPVLDGVWVADADIESVLEATCEAADPILESQ